MARVAYFTIHANCVVASEKILCNYWVQIIHACQNMTQTEKKLNSSTDKNINDISPLQHLLLRTLKEGATRASASRSTS